MVEAAPKTTNLRAHLAALAVAVLAAILMTWPLALEAGDHILKAAYYWDAYTNAMLMGSRVDAALSRGPLSLYDSYYFAPLPNTIVFNENHFGLSLIFAPFYLLSENPLWAYNMTLLISLALSAFFTYLLVRRLTGSAHAGIWAGVAFAFCPYVFFELGRIQLVATQWIPACFLTLHRAIEGRRLRDAVLFWVCYLLQIGTCLYYAMFLIPLLSLVGLVLLVRQKPPLRVYAQLLGVGVLAGVVAFLMVHPYFSTRDSFDLERSLAFASSYDGKLGFFSNVHETNHTLTSLHHQAELRGAHEEIAFPGFVVLGLAILALASPLLGYIGAYKPRQLAIALGAWLAIAALALLGTLLTHSMLVGVVVVGLGVGLQVRRASKHPFGGRRGMYLAVLLLAIVMFLGLFPFEWGGEPVHGLYYYFHTYFPGFNGIRKVSRQAVMTTFVFCVLAAFGGAFLFSKLGHARTRGVLLLALLMGTGYELRSFPHTMQPVWAGASVPEAFEFVKALPEHDFVASVPQAGGKSLFWGDSGLALHNYLALYHKHRFVNGQSSWMPQVTELVRQSLARLPDDAARRVLLEVGTRHLMIFGEDLRAWQSPLPGRLLALPEQYRRVFEHGSHSVFSLVVPDDPTLTLLDTPALPESAQAIPISELTAHTNLQPRTANRAIDGNSQTRWTSGRPQAKGQYFELGLDRARRVVALEIRSPHRVMDVPASFTLSVATQGSSLRPLVSQPVLRLHHEQIFSPKTFVFRVVLPEPTWADRVRITLQQPVPGHYFSVYEARLFAADEP